MKRRCINATLLVFLWVGCLAACASRGPTPEQHQQLNSQPNTGKPVDYLHFAGLSYGDTFDDLVELFGEPTSVDPGDEQDTSASVSYEINGEECMHVIYDRPTRRVGFVRVVCRQIYDFLRSKRIGDPKLELLAQHKDLILERYGAPDETQSGHYAYDFQNEGEAEGRVTFACYDHNSSLCNEIWVQWFYPLTEAEENQLMESLLSDLDELSEEKQRKIRQLLELTKATDQGQEIFDAILSSMKRPLGISDDAWAELMEEFKFQDLIEQMVPVYAKHLTDKEIDDLIAFYSTPTGRSFIDKQPDLFKDIIAVSQEWAKAATQRMREKVEARKKKSTGP